MSNSNFIVQNGISVGGATGATIAADSSTGAIVITPAVTASTPNPVATVITNGAVSTVTTTGGVASTANISTAVTAASTGGSVFAGTTSSQAAKFTNMGESASIIASAPGSTVNFYVASGAIQYHTTAAANNWTLNVAWSSGTSMNTAMSTGDVVSIAHMVTNTGSAYYPTAFQVDGASITPKWQGGTAPTSGDTSAVDIYTYTVIKTGNAAFTIFATQTKFA